MQNAAPLYCTIKKIQRFEDRVIWRCYGRFSRTITPFFSPGFPLILPSPPPLPPSQLAFSLSSCSSLFSPFLTSSFLNLSISPLPLSSPSHHFFILQPLHLSTPSLLTFPSLLHSSTSPSLHSLSPHLPITSSFLNLSISPLPLSSPSHHFFIPQPLHLSTPSLLTFPSLLHSSTSPSLHSLSPHLPITSSFLNLSISPLPLSSPSHHFLPPTSHQCDIPK